MIYTLVTIPTDAAAGEYQYGLRAREIHCRSNTELTNRKMLETKYKIQIFIDFKQTFDRCKDVRLEHRLNLYV